MVRLITVKKNKTQIIDKVRKSLQFSFLFKDDVNNIMNVIFTVKK